MPASPAASLFASNYSLSAPNSPSSTHVPSPRPSPSPRPTRTPPARTLTPSAPASPSPLRPRPIEINFPTEDVPLADLWIAPPISPYSAPLISPHGGPVNLPPFGEDRWTSRPAPVSGRKKSVQDFLDDPLEEHRLSLTETRRKSLGYSDFEGV